MPELRDALARRLTKSGMTITACESATQVLAILTGDDPVDLLLTDFEMPDMAGDQLIAAAQKLRDGLPVILLTGHCDSAAEFIKNYTGHGILRLLSKPISSKDLIDTIGLMLRQQTERA